MEKRNIRISGYGEKDALFSITDGFIEDAALSPKSGLRLRLVVEEIAEMLKLLDDERSADIDIEGDRESLRIRLTLQRRAEGSEDTSWDLTGFNGVTDKIRFLLSSSYETLEALREEAEALGVRKQKAKHLKEAGYPYDEDAYVWTMEAYNFSAFDRFEEFGEVDWGEISHSIIANLSDDIRIFIFPDRTEHCVYVSFNEKRAEKGDKYGIDPELLPLYKIPVAKSRFQIRLVQLLYKRLHYKQRSTPEYSLIRHTIPIDASPKKNLTVLEYIPAGFKDSDRALPTVLFPHGGAFLFPGLPYHYRLAAEVTTRVSCRVFFPIYDLAPKYAPPIQIKEVFELYRYLLDNAGRYHIDRERIAVMGDSSGGTISAAICLLARDEGLQKPCAQLLLYPSLDTRGETLSMKKYPDVPVVNSEAVNAYKKILNADKEEGRKYYLSPIEASSLSELPPAYIEPAEFDALHDEGVAYAEALKEAGCEVELNETKGTVHSFDMAKDSRVFLAALDRRIEFLKRSFAGAQDDRNAGAQDDRNAGAQDDRNAGVQDDK